MGRGGEGRQTLEVRLLAYPPSDCLGDTTASQQVPRKMKTG